MATQLCSTSVQVSSDFMWMNRSSDNTLPIGTYRAHDEYVQWRDIETSAGVYSWTALDALITTHRTLGRSISYVIYGTPTFYASVADQGHNDYYGNPGAAGFPALDTNLNAFKAFITALITRYNSAGGAWRVANPTLGKGIKFIETWNEPDFTETYTGYWWGTVAQMVDVCTAGNSAAKAVDSSLITLAPSFDSDSRFEQWIAGTGTLFSTSAPATCDAWNTHIYAVSSYGYNYAFIYKDPVFGTQGAFGINKIASKYSQPKPVYITEIGFNTDPTNKAFLSLLAESDASIRYKLLARIFLAAAAYGVRGVGMYNASNLCGNLTTDVNGVRKAFIDVATFLAGKTIISGLHTLGDSIEVRCLDGSVMTV